MALNLPVVGPNDVWGNLINAALNALDQRLTALENATTGDAMTTATNALNIANDARGAVTALSGTVSGISTELTQKVDRVGGGSVRLWPVSTMPPSAGTGQDGDLYFQADP